MGCAVFFPFLTSARYGVKKNEVPLFFNVISFPEQNETKAGKMTALRHSISESVPLIPAKDKKIVSTLHTKPEQKIVPEAKSRDRIHACDDRNTIPAKAEQTIKSETPGNSKQNQPVSFFSQKNTIVVCAGDLRPVYPLVSRKRGEEGKVILQVAIDSKGVLSNITVLKSSGFVHLDKASIQALQTVKFIPATCAGIPVPSQQNFVFDFRLTR
jgi:periplasmic protein TonB